MERYLQGLEQANHSGRDDISLLSLYLRKETEPRLTFRQRDKSLLMPFANYCIEFPIPEPGTAIHDGRAMFDGDAVAQLAATTIRPIAFPALSLAPQMRGECPVGGFVLEHMPVDPLMTNLYRLSVV